MLGTSNKSKEFAGVVYIYIYTLWSPLFSFEEKFFVPFNFNFYFTFNF